MRRSVSPKGERCDADPGPFQVRYLRRSRVCSASLRFACAALRPKEVGCYVPELSGERQAVQSNDIGTDDNGLLYLIDRAGAGMHILEYTG